MHILIGEKNGACVIEQCPYLDENVRFSATFAPLTDEKANIILGIQEKY